jgi:hypothetical protein
MFRREPDHLRTWALAAGAAATGGVLAYGAARLVRAIGRARAFRRPVAQPGAYELDALEDAAVALLRSDPQTGGCAIDVAAVAPGTLELSGVVPAREIGQRAARLLERLPAVRTVILRLDEDSLEAHLADNRERHARGEAAWRERRWYGVRVGTGRRRQSPATDPERPDDSVDRRTRQLEVRQDEAAEPGLPAHPAADVVRRPL